MAKSRRPTPTAAPTRRTTPAPTPTSARFIAPPPSAHVEGDEDGLFSGGDTTSPTTRALRGDLRKVAVAQANLRQRGRAPSEPDADTEEDTPDVPDTRHRPRLDVAVEPLDDEESDRDDEPTDDADAAYVAEQMGLPGAYTPAPMPWMTPSVAAPAPRVAACQLVDATVEDVDRLWDWLRADGATTFLGQPVTTSVMLHQLLLQLVRGEAVGTSLVRAIQYDARHLGFVILAPILADTRSAIFNVYVAPVMRSAIGAILQEVLPAVLQAVPGYHLCVWSTDPQWEALHRQTLTPLGFVAHTMFVR